MNPERLAKPSGRQAALVNEPQHRLGMHLQLFGGVVDRAQRLADLRSARSILCGPRLLGIRDGARFRQARFYAPAALLFAQGQIDFVFSHPLVAQRPLHVRRFPSDVVVSRLVVGLSCHQAQIHSGGPIRHLRRLDPGQAAIVGMSARGIPRRAKCDFSAAGVQTDDDPAPEVRRAGVRERVGRSF